MTRRPSPCIALAALLLVAVPLAGCGDHRKHPGGGDAENGAGEATTTPPHIGRDAKEVVSAFGEDGRAVLEQAERVTLYTLNPSRLVDGALSPEKERFHGYGILGSAELGEPGEQRRVVEAVYEGLKAEGAGPASCFFPRHALRFEQGARSFDLLICFECTWVYLFTDDGEHETRMLFGAGVKPVFDALIKKHALKTDRP